MSDLSFTILAKPNTGDWYEGSRTFLRPIQPRPVVAPARVENMSVSITVVFREDTYDPTTRIRRGRFYRRTNGVQIASGLVQFPSHPRPATIGGASGGSVVDFQSAFEQANELNSMISNSEGYGIILGIPPAETRWRVIDAEGLSDGTTLFSLRALSSSGLLPVITTADQSIKEASEKVIDAALKYAPVPVVDVCREATRLALAKYLNEDGDLATLIKKIKNNEYMIQSAATIINRLHPRGKSSEQERQDKSGKILRRVIDEDAVLAVRLFGFLLIEMNFANP
jgi:hypothetical protein